VTGAPDFDTYYDRDIPGSIPSNNKYGTENYWIELLRKSSGKFSLEVTYRDGDRGNTTKKNRTWEEFVNHKDLYTKWRAFEYPGDTPTKGETEGNHNGGIPLPRTGFYVMNTAETSVIDPGDDSINGRWMPVFGDARKVYTTDPVKLKLTYYGRNFSFPIPVYTLTSIALVTKNAAIQRPRIEWVGPGRGWTDTYPSTTSPAADSPQVGIGTAISAAYNVVGTYTGPNGATSTRNLQSINNGAAIRNGYFVRWNTDEGERITSGNLPSASDIENDEGTVPIVIEYWNPVTTSTKANGYPTTRSPTTSFRDSDVKRTRNITVNITVR